LIDLIERAHILLPYSRTHVRNWERQHRRK
jgi:hypothetical protein